MSSNPSPPSRILPWWRRLSTGLQIAFVLLALIPAATLTAVSILRERDREQAAAEHLLEVYADAGRNAVEEWVRTSKGIFSFDLNHPNYGPLMAALVSSGEEGGSDENVVDFVAHAGDVVNSTDFDYLVLVDPQGVIHGASDPQLAGRNLSTEVWFRQALDSPDEVIVAGPLRDPLNGQEGLFFAGAVVDPESGQPVGVLAGRTGLTPIREMLSDVLPSGVFGSTGEYFLVREGQQYVTLPRFVLQATLATDTILPVAMSGAEGTDTWTDYRGEEVIGVYRWVPSLGMSLIVKQDVGEALSGTRERIQTSLLVGALIALLAVLLAFVTARRITTPLSSLSETAQRLSQGDLDARAPASGFAEFQQVANSLNLMTGRLRSLIESQEETIRARTRQLQITAQIGRAIAAETNVQRLLDVAINRIRDQLGHYHAQVFLLDDLRQYAVLRASTGDAGQALLERGHRLPVGSRSVIGQVTSVGEQVLASDTLRAEFWMPNPLLPSTRAELAVPIRVGEQIIGALDVQSTEPDAFDVYTIAALQTIADQLAVALRNAQLFEEKEGLISASVQLTQMLTRDSWDSYVAGRRGQGDDIGFSYDLSGVKPLGDARTDLTGGDGDNGNGFTMPIALRGEVIGDLEASLAPGQTWSEDERQLVSDVLDRVALALENARLFEQTQVSLQETNRLYHASRRITGADSMPVLAQELVSLAAIEAAERVAVFLLDDPEHPPGDRWVEMVGLWTKDSADPVNTLPKRLRTGQPPLLGIESTPAEGRVIDNAASDSELSAAARDNFEQLGVKSATIFPLLAGRRTVGWLAVHNLNQSSAFTESQVRYYRTLADQAATALEGMRLLEQTQIRARRLQATNEVSRAASSILNSDILLPLVVDQVSQAFGYYHVQIFLMDEMGEYDILRASTGEIGKKLLASGHSVRVGSQSVIGQVTETGNPLLVRDTDTDPIHRRNELLPETRSELAIPLKTGDRVIGALDVQSTQINAFDGEAQAILQSLAGELAVTLENAQLFQEIQDRVAELTTINLVAQAVSRANTLEEVYDVVVSQLQRTFGARNGYLAVLDEESQTIHLPIFMENGEIRRDIPTQPLGAGLTSHVIETKQVLLINENLEQEAIQRGARVLGSVTKSMLAVPLLVGEEVIGVLSIQDPDQEHAYNEAHVRQLTTLAAYIAVKVRNAELLDEAQSRARELGFLFDVTRAAVATSDLDASLSNVVEILRREIDGVESAIIYLASEDGGQLEPHAAVGYGRDMAARGPISWGHGMIGYVATIAQSMIIRDAQLDTIAAGGDTRTRSAVLVPLMTASGLIGVLSVESTHQEEFDERDLRLLETASSTLTAIIQNNRLLDEISRANEQLQELDRLKSQFLANMSHELRTPLNSIIGFSRVMLKGIDGPLSDLQTQDLSTIYNSGHHLLGLINNILDISKIEAKMMEIQPEYTGLEEIIDTVLSTAKGLIKDRPIELFKEYPENLPQVWGDPQRIRQVLLNLVSNAAKFTKEGSITIRAFRREADPAAKMPASVQVDVIDTGIGIPADKLDTIFEPFQQVDGTTTRQYEGTGLGLPISKNFIDLHSGQIWVTSDVDKGSVFSFTIPLHPPLSEGEEVPSRAADDSRPLVLAVDDEPGVIDLYTRYLEKEGYAVIGLGHANDLVPHAAELKPQAILLDLHLPGKDGWTAIDDLKQNAETRHIPILVCSIDEDRERTTHAGAAAHLVKPILEDDLIGTLQGALQGAPDVMHSVLVIDAYPDHAAYIRAALESTGAYSVRAVSMGFEGLQAAQEAPPDAMVIDLDLPDMDGYGLLVSMRSQEGTQHLPVVVLTARPVSEEELARLGPDHTGYLSKHDYDAVRLVESLSALMVGEAHANQ